MSSDLDLPSPPVAKVNESEDSNQNMYLQEDIQAGNCAGKDLDNILAADAEDESLRKYKESLLGSAVHGDRGDITDPRSSED